MPSHHSRMHLTSRKKGKRPAFWNSATKTSIPIAPPKFLTKLPPRTCVKTWNSATPKPKRLWNFWKNNCLTSKRRWIARSSNSTPTATKLVQSISEQRPKSSWKNATSYSKNCWTCNKRNRAPSVCSSRNTRLSKLLKNKRTT